MYVYVHEHAEKHAYTVGILCAVHKGFSSQEMGRILSLRVQLFNIHRYKRISVSCLKQKKKSQFYFFRIKMI